MSHGQKNETESEILMESTRPVFFFFTHDVLSDKKLLREAGESFFHFQSQLGFRLKWSSTDISKKLCNMKFLRARSLSLKCVRNIFISRARTSQVDAVSQSIVKAGYRAETHKTKTDDGYILTLHRLLPQLHSGHKGSAFLMHGLFKDSSDFIATGPKTALAYYLADNGFDVWLGTCDLFAGHF